MTKTKSKKSRSKPKKHRESEYTPEQLAEIEKQYRQALWYINLNETNNKCFMPLFECESRYLVLMGGGGSGKSIFAGRKILERVTSEAGHRWLVVRKVAKTLRESCSEQLIRQLNKHYPHVKYKQNLTDMTITLENGSEILFTGADNIEKIKSIVGISGIWIEEASELLDKDFNQLDIRMRDETVYYKQIIISFNPISITHWLKKRFFDTPDERAMVHRSTYKDNRFLSDDYIKTLEKFKDTDEYYYQVYALGQWGVTGKTVFNAVAISERLSEIQPPKRTGIFEFDEVGTVDVADIYFRDDKNGYIRIYKEPKAGVPYVIGGDTAGEGSDKFVAQVIDNRTGEQVAVLRQTFDEDLFTKQIYCLGKYYNTALIGIETNFSTYPVKFLQLMRYPRQYVREGIDDYTGKPKQSFGFQTNQKTRNYAIAELVKAFRENPACVVDEATLEEMSTFVRNEKFKPEAEAGANDDCVMALAIAHAIRHQQRYTEEVPKAKGKAKWTKGMLEDYQNADKAGKEYMIKKWGKPAK